MRNLRPFAWAIIAANIYFVYLFFKGAFELEQDNLALGMFTITFLFIWAVVNVILYVIYRVTSRSSSRVCPACASKVKTGITLCSNCGFDFMKFAMGVNEEKEISKSKEFDTTNQAISQKGKVEWKKPVLAFVALAIISALISSQKNSQDNWSAKKAEVSQNIQDYTIDNSWIPSGFLKFDESIAIRYLKNPKCSYSDSFCVGIQIVSKDGCPNNLYGEISIKNKNGVEIGYTNDTLSSLPSGVKGELIFDILEWERFGGFRLTKISCY